MYELPTPFVPPRGSWAGGEGKPPHSTWLDPATLHEPMWRQAPGKLTLGLGNEGQFVAYSDDRHVVTIAGSRAGKTATMLVPNLREYPGSAIVIDPKGELAEQTAAHRHHMGQDVHILDPFGEVQARGTLRRIIEHNRLEGLSDESASFNALDELAYVERPDDLMGEAASFAEALIVASDKDAHWGESSRKILQAVCLHLMQGSAQPATLNSAVRFFASSEIQKITYEEMRRSNAFDGFLKDVGDTNERRMNSRSEEYPSIISNGDTQLAPLRDLRRISESSSFSLRDLKRRPTTIYLVLPASKMGSHYRWLRMIITLALSALERERSVPEHPVLFVLEEFAALGHMRPIERAAGYIAGFGVKLWSVLQDLPQLKTQYPKSWQTFLGNAGVIQVFGLNDGATEEMISERLGTIQYEFEDVTRKQLGFTHRQVNEAKARNLGRLLEPHEVRLEFARETHRQIVLVPNQPPIALFRLPFPKR